MRKIILISFVNLTFVNYICKYNNTHNKYSKSKSNQIKNLRKK